MVFKETYDEIHTEILKRIESLCKAGLNQRNTIAVINEYTLSEINYCIGAIPVECVGYSRIYEDVRKIVVRYNMNFQLANTERLYLPRRNLGRGLSNVVHNAR